MPRAPVETLDRPGPESVTEDMSDSPSDPLEGLFTPFDPAAPAEDTLDGLPPVSDEDAPLYSPEDAFRPVPSAGQVPLDPYLLDCVCLEPEALTEEFSRLPTDFARWNEVHTSATELALKARLHVARTRAERRKSYRRNLAIHAQAAHAKPTESFLEDLVCLDGDVRLAEDALVLAERERTRVRGILSALSRKAEALQSIGATRRAELAINPDMREKPLARRG